MRIDTEGIVLKNRPFGEADLIVTYLTKREGIVDTFAKSPRKIKSRFGSSLEPLTKARITFIGREQSMPRLIRSDIIKSHHLIREDLRAFLRVSLLIEIILNMLPKKYGSEELFNLFSTLLEDIESSLDKDYRDSIWLSSIISLLSFLGYA
ncbi:MAG: DNA repair protein RecO, partial [Nitrospirae bacterium]